MEQYISKSDLSAEIERRIKEIEEIGTYLSPKGVLTNLLCYLNTFEVKEVDLEKDVDRILEEYDWNYEKIDFYNFAKHFFELGIKVQTEDVMEKIANEITRLQDMTMDANHNFCSGYNEGRFDALTDLNKFLDTLK